MGGDRKEQRQLPPEKKVGEEEEEEEEAIENESGLTIVTAKQNRRKIGRREPLCWPSKRRVVR